MFIIDRFEGDWAVIEIGRKTFNLPKALLPANTKEGDVISINVTVDQGATAERRKKAKNLLEGFFDE